MKRLTRMIQSVYNRDFRDPKQITEREMNDDGKLKSNLEQKISIYVPKLSEKCSRVKRCEKKIDFRSENCKVLANKKVEKVSHSSTMIMNRCLNNDDKRLFKSKSTVSGRLCEGPVEMTKPLAIKARRNVKKNLRSKSDIICCNFVSLIGQFTEPRTKCQSKWMLRSSNVQVPLHWSDRTASFTFGKVKPFFEKLQRISRWIQQDRRLDC